MARSLADLREELLRLIDLTGLSDRKQEIVAAAKPSVRIFTKPSPGAEATSFVGGHPTNKEVVWPVCNQGLALTHLAQIHLSDIAPYFVDAPAPKSGMLNFFIDLQEFGNGNQHDDIDGWKVIYTPEPKPSVERPEVSPEGYELASDWPDLDPDLPFCPISFTQDLTIPSFRSIEILPLGKLEFEAYDALRNKLADLVDQTDSIHRMFGHPDAVQGCMQIEAQFVTNAAYLPSGVHNYFKHPRAGELMPGAHDWLLLFQLDSNKTPGWMWGDWGRVYFWIKSDDLARCAFEKTWHFLQCH
jgi:uncharacterized protein YwqG